MKKMVGILKLTKQKQKPVKWISLFSSSWIDDTSQPPNTWVAPLPPPPGLLSLAPRTLDLCQCPPSLRLTDFTVLSKQTRSKKPLLYTTLKRTFSPPQQYPANHWITLNDKCRTAEFTDRGLPAGSGPLVGLVRRPGKSYVFFLASLLPLGFTDWPFGLDQIGNSTLLEHRKILCYP